MSHAELLVQHSKVNNDEMEHERFVLYECLQTNVNIVLHRNLRQQFEYVLMSHALVPVSYSKGFFYKNFFMMDEYQVLLCFKSNIVDYLHQCEHRQQLFEAFFNMSINAFFRSIDSHSS